MEYVSSQLIRYSRACGSYHDFLDDRGFQLTKKQLSQVSLVVRGHHFYSLTVFSNTLLTVTEYLCLIWPLICSLCRNHNPMFSSFLTYHWICNKNNMRGATSGTGTADPSEPPRFTSCFSGTRVAQSSDFCVVFCRSLFVFLSFLPWPLSCLFFDLLPLITLFVSSNSV